VGESTPGRLTGRLRTVKREEPTAWSRQNSWGLPASGRKPAVSETTTVSADHEKGRSQCLSNRLKNALFWKGPICNLFTKETYLYWPFLYFN
jgi:hypothetical protein